MGHINYNKINKLVSNTVGCDITKKQQEQENKQLWKCIKAKQENKINRSSSNKELEYLDKVCSDIWGPTIPTYNNYKYYISFLDKATRYLEVTLLRSKSEAYTAFYACKQQAENNKGNEKDS